MNIIGKIALPLCFTATLGFGATYRGKLIDASCYDTQKTEHHLAKRCEPSASTTQFALRTSSGKIYKLDSSGNSALSEDMQKGMLKARKNGDIHASLDANREGMYLNVRAVIVNR